MKKVLFTLLFLYINHCLLSQVMNEKIKYPHVKKVSDADEYFGVKVTDPYRWLEDDRSKETAAWVQEQNKLTFSYLDKIPFRNKIKDRLSKIWNFEKQSAPFKKGEYYFYYKNDGMQNQSVLYVKKGLTGTERVLIDPNQLSKEGLISLNGLNISKDAKYLAYSISKAGSDWNEIYVMEIESGKTLKDKIEWVKFSSIAFKKDGFYYSKYDVPVGSELSNKNEYHKIYFHKIGTEQSTDVLIYQDKTKPQRNFAAITTDDEETLIISFSDGTSGNGLIVKDLKNEQSEFKVIVEETKDDFNVVEKLEGDLLVLTNYESPNNKLILINPNNSNKQNWKTLIPETKDLLESVTVAGNKFVVKYLSDVKTKMFICNSAGVKENEIELPAIGKVDVVNGDKNDDLIFYSFVNYTQPTSIYKYSLSAKKSELWFKPKMDFNSEAFETKQVFYKSKDGTKVPMFIVHKKGIVLDGNNPCLLYGYGGFDISLAPSFSIPIAFFIESGGVYAVANLRGGGEYGKDWHMAGTKLKKQNVFDDFIAAADYLKKEKYTQTSKLAIHGRSNGGLLIGATITQQPNIAKVALPGVGVLDMLRYHKFTIGWAWAGDYGTSEESEEMFKYLYAYSPLHNTKPAEYPATMVVTADHDDRVVPAHSFKFISALQDNQKGSNPCLIRVDVNAGHGAGKPTAKQIDEWADIISFMFYNFNISY